MDYNLTAERPIYAQLVESFQRKILSGELQAGGKLPSVRDLAVQAKVNPNTMQKAMSELEDTGLVYSVRTTGRFITEDTALIASMRQRLAEKEIELFLTIMKKMGFDREQTLELIQKMQNPQVCEEKGVQE